MAKELFVTKYRWPIIIGCLLMTAVMGMQLRNLEIDASTMALLPATMPSRINTAKIEKIFETIFVFWQNILDS